MSDLENMTLLELRNFAKEHNIKNISKLKKEELIVLLNQIKDSSKPKVICPLCNSFMTSFSNRRILIYVSVRKFPLPDAGSSHRRFDNFVWKSLSFLSFVL